MPITQTILDTAHDDPERIALAEGDRALTYGELLRRAPQIYACIAQTLARLPDTAVDAPADVGDVPVVAVSLAHALDAAELVAVFSGYRLVTCVLDPGWPIQHRVRSVMRAGARIVVSDETDFVDALRTAGWGGAAVAPTALRAAPAEAAAVQPMRRPDDEPFLLIFTSGTTDEPKGFLRTRAAWRYNTAISARYLRSDDGLRTIAPGPLSYSLTLYALVEVLASAGSLWLQSAFDPLAAVRTIDERSIQRLVSVPAVLPALAAAARHRASSLPTLHSVIVGGAQLSERMRTEFEAFAPGAELISYYGAAEIGFIGRSLAGDGAELELFEGVEVRIRDERGRDVAPGQLGQLFVRVDSQGDRYVSTTGGTRITGADGWATVADQASFADGLLRLAGRAGDIAVTGGHKVSLQQVDRALETIPGCEVCCTVTQPDAALGEVLVAIIERQGETPVPEKRDILEHLRVLLPPQFRPRRFYTADRLPRTVGGKIRRGAVRAELETGRYTRM